MIEIQNLVKTFDEIVALDNLSLKIPDGSVLGLVGSNGSGKSTLLRTISGVYIPDSGKALVNGESSFENISVKGQCYFIPDYPFYYGKSTLASHASYLRKIYPNWSDDVYNHLLNVFSLNPKAKILHMSKGMQRQASLLLAFSTQPKYLFLDEIFDGLDPVIRQVVKKLIINNVAQYNMTAVIASHNLRELEDLCDRIALIHRGRLILHKDLDDMKEDFCKVQIALTGSELSPLLEERLNIFSYTKNGSVYNLVIKGVQDDIISVLKEMSPVFLEVLPLTLEEVFISEMENINYDIKNILSV